MARVMVAECELTLGLCTKMEEKMGLCTLWLASDVSLSHPHVSSLCKLHSIFRFSSICKGLPYWEA